MLNNSIHKKTACCFKGGLEWVFKRKSVLSARYLNYIKQQHSHFVPFQVQTPVVSKYPVHLP